LPFFILEMEAIQKIQYIDGWLRISIILQEKINKELYSFGYCQRD